MIDCLICGKSMKGLTLHLLKTHNMTPKDYRGQFGDVPIFDNSVRKQMSDTATGVKKQPMKESTKAKLSAIQKSRPSWNHSPETIAKMRETGKRLSDVKRQTTIRLLEETDIRKNMSVAQRKRIARDGIHHLRNKRTQLEISLSRILSQYGFHHEHQVHKLVNGTGRFYDFFIPSLNMLIEIDGERWHTSPDRIQIDIEKQEYAFANGFRFIRISDRDLTLYGRRREIADSSETYIIELILASDDVQRSHAESIISRRTENVSHL